MNRSPNMLLIFSVFSFIVLLPALGLAASVGNIGDPMVWDPGPFQKEGGISIVTSLMYGEQTNRLSEQMTRFPWTNPTTQPLEERHYEQIRSSKNALSTMGVKIGVPYKDKALFYAVAGKSDAKVNFHYGDWTVLRGFETDNSFESDSDFFYGLGTSFVMQRGEVQKIPLTLGMDISYRRYSIEENRIASEGLSYSSDLDEIQMAVCLAAKLEKFSPYAGVKVASITGTEDYINKNFKTLYFEEGYIHYDQDITWSKNVGYFFGATTSIKGWVSLGIEFRGGDENAMELSATTKF